MAARPETAAKDRTRRAEDLFRHHHHRLVAHLARTFGARHAEDMASEVWVKLSRGFLPDPDRPAWPWLRVVAERAAIDFLRRHPRSSPEHLDADVPEAGDSFDQVDLRLVLGNALAQLGSTERDTILGQLAGYSAQDLAARHGKSRHAMHCLTSRARERLRAILGTAALSASALIGSLRRRSAGLGQHPFTIELALAAVLVSQSGQPIDDSLAPVRDRVPAVVVTTDAVEPARAAAPAHRGRLEASVGSRAAEASDGPAPGNREPSIRIDHRDGAAIPREVVIYWPTIDTPLGPANGETRLDCVSNGFEVLPRNDDLYRLC